MKSREEIMNMLEAFDLTGSLRDAGELAGCSHHTVAAYVARRDEGRLGGVGPVRRKRIIDPWLAKIEEWVERSCGKIRADRCHAKLKALGFEGSDRTVRRAVAEAKNSFGAGRRRVYRPWIGEPGMWAQWDWGAGPIIAGRRTNLFCAWLAWSRFRVVIATWDRTLPTVIACVDRAMRAFGGAPTYWLTDNERTVTIDHVAGVPVRHPEMVAVGGHYGITIATCVPADPESKGGSEATVRIAKADLVPTVVLTHTATGGDYGSVTGTVTVNITDDDSAAIVVVTLVQIPDGTVIPDNSSLTADGVGMTVVDGLTWGEGEHVMYRLLFAAVGGGPPAGDGVDVELSFFWDIDSPIAGLSPNGPNAESWTKDIFVVSTVTSLHRTEVWDTAVQAYDDGVGSPDGKLTIRITDCWRSGCVIGEPSKLTVTILDNDGGPATSPPGRPDPPRLVCAPAGDGYDPTGIAASWKAPAFRGGADIEGYELRQRRSSSSAYPWAWNNWQAWSHFVTATSTTLTGLESGVFYGVQVRAVNANGAGPWSLPKTFMTGLSDDLCEIFDRRTPHP